jgi:protocatechuate 3,4-dioxygenase beta subunit
MGRNVSAAERQTNAVRRQFLRQCGWAAAASGAALWLETPGAFAEELTRTPRQTEGPFYPVNLPLDTDNDLIIVNDQLTPAVGEITHLSGCVRDLSGRPLRNIGVEIWQCDHNGAYLHEASSNRDRRDENFQGFGRFLTASSGEYYFRTIKPVPYPGRTPHIHFAIKRNGRKIFSTQCYVKGHPGNPRDGVWSRIAAGAAREAVTIDFAPLAASTTGELAARFDIVLGATPQD